MFGIVAASKIPVCAQLATSFEIESLGDVGFRVDGKVGVTELIGPDVVGVCD